ncbi:MAG: T9SS type A sorting domain-containing protein [Bacteroidales bacterium]
MKKLFSLFKAFLFVLFTSFSLIVNAQLCTPDHTGYTTVPDTGVRIPFWPPHATVGVYYELSVTYGVPAHVKYGGTKYSINWAQFTKITNYLTGNIWTVVDNNGGSTFDKWDKLTWQCGTIKGTPTMAGIDTISIYADVNVNIIFIPYTQKNARAYRIPLIVDAATATDISNNTGIVETKLIESKPNPYHNFTQIGIVASKSDKAVLNVYSSFGQLVYSETKSIITGENYFDFNGSKLISGTYFYSVITSVKIFNKILIKTE